MKSVLLYSLLLILGLVISQFLPDLVGDSLGSVSLAINLLTMIALAFIMIHVGLEFDIDRTRLRSYAVDYGVAATAAAFPWILCSVYFIAFVLPVGSWGSGDAWKDALLAGRFAAPTSAGILFSMLIAAGLSTTWLFRKARILAIFDDLDTVLLMIPLKMMIVGLRWQLGVVVLVMGVLLWLAWKYLHRLNAPTTWRWMLGYSTAIAVLFELIHLASKYLDDVVPIHIEVLLPAFVFGCILVRPHDQGHTSQSTPVENHSHSSPTDHRVEMTVSAVFMVLVGLSMPRIQIGTGGELAELLIHTFWLTVLSNLGKMFPLFCYRTEAGWRERLALCIGLWPRGEVGAGVLIVSLSYGIGGMIVAAATLSLALNLLCTGIFIYWVKALLARSPKK